MEVEGAPHDCPGVQSEEAGRAAACAGCPNQVSQHRSAAPTLVALRLPAVVLPFLTRLLTCRPHARRRRRAPTPMRRPSRPACSTLGTRCGAPTAAHCGHSRTALCFADPVAAARPQILVLSGKGGVGKSTFSAQLAFALAAAGKQVRQAASPPRVRPSPCTDR